VLDWKNQAIEILNEPGFSVTDRGPLHGDIRTFKIRRDDCLILFIDTEAARGGNFPPRAIPPGTARINPDNVTLENPSGAKAALLAWTPGRVMNAAIRSAKSLGFTSSP
jgi:hypothetical protein